MKRPQICCWLAVAILCGVTSQSTRATIECSNPPPGVRKMVRGVDITKLDVIPVELIAANGYKSPVLNFTCNRQRTWINPQGTQYQLPDQVWHMTTLPGGWLSAEASLYKTHRDVRRSMTNNVGGEGSIWKFAFSASGSYTRMQNTITNTSKYISDISSFDSASRVDFIPSWAIQLDSFAAMFIDQMITGTFESNPAVYNRFIEEFGTHYFSTANFGGYIRVVIETNTNYFYSKTEREAKANAKASFLKIITVHGGHVSGSTTVEETFRRQSSQNVLYYGGDTNLLTENGISQWQPTVDADPWLFSGTLKPISDLITDNTKKQSMIRAVANHVMRAYLDELQRLINTGRSKSSDSVLNSLQTRLNTLSNGATLVESQVEALGRDVEAQLIVPDWFSSKTKLCFKWWPDGDGGQCGGGANRLLCAKPNSMTAVYRDDTDRRGGGCRMQWGIQSQGAPGWFNQVQVCYRWYPDGDGGQCGGGAARLLCANINNYSPVYRDDTDRRGGGCQMSWRIVVPSSAPLWLKTAKLCYSWYPDGDGGQCSGPSRNMCAVANQWTPYYRDDTDRRSGGCRMSWGLKTEF